MTSSLRRTFENSSLAPRRVRSGRVWRHGETGVGTRPPPEFLLRSFTLTERIFLRHRIQNTPQFFVYTHTVPPHPRVFRTKRRGVDSTGRVAQDLSRSTDVKRDLSFLPSEFLKKLVDYICGSDKDDYCRTTFNRRGRYSPTTLLGPFTRNRTRVFNCTFRAKIWFGCTPHPDLVHEPVPLPSTGLSEDRGRSVSETLVAPGPSDFVLRCSLSELQILLVYVSPSRQLYDRAVYRDFLVLTIYLMTTQSTFPWTE